jgi:hypothetical protein
LYIQWDLELYVRRWFSPDFASGRIFADGVSCSVSLVFRDIGPAGSAGRSSLLQDMRQLVREQPESRGCVRRVVTCGEGDILAASPGNRTVALRSRCGCGTVMHTDGAEIGTECRLEPPPEFGGQQPAT